MTQLSSYFHLTRYKSRLRGTFQDQRARCTEFDSHVASPSPAVWQRNRNFGGDDNDKRGRLHTGSADYLFDVLSQISATQRGTGSEHIPDDERIPFSSPCCQPRQSTEGSTRSLYDKRSRSISYASG
ncbi:uncharacterized protein ARMOST_02370 [Armillaria ostoyae]|uniref:Uncharacterized protein n=1 Tax=Armillaria ostoyae TaxID=47428 RepID=A0A284QRJ7_ARMOS|nr:uncharacterized protein ARMOST_02370 [Armillaria ostoyae]